MTPLLIALVMGPSVLVGAWRITVPGGTWRDLRAEVSESPRLWAVAVAGATATAWALMQGLELATGV